MVEPRLLGVGIMTFFQSLFQHHPSSPLGKAWQGESAAKAFETKQLASDPSANNESVRICFRNCSPHTLLLCWMDQQGNPHHFYQLKPTDVFSGPVTVADRTERSKTGHAFLLAFGSPTQVQQAQASKSLKEVEVVGGYRASITHAPGTKAPQYPVHVLTIEERLQAEACCCSPRLLPFLRGSHKRKRQDAEQDEDGSLTWCLKVCHKDMDLTPMDTTGKHYDSHLTLGGWPVRCEPNWHGGDESVKETLTKDIEHAISCLPEHAREALRPHTPIWINRTFTYGPKTCPIIGRGLCFHPDVEWLRENGCLPEKGKCVEMYTVQEYMQDRSLWGRGGLLIHEFSHAYHNKCLSDGYENSDIKACYEAAMKLGLYDRVPVHGRQGPTAKAYACENCMEYFAELSAAFLGGTDDQEEFNKWFPFNRKQIKEHDPRAYELLKRVWKVQD